MKNLFSSFYILISIHVSAQAPYTSQFNQLMNESEAKDAFSGNVMIAKEGKVVYKNSVGFADWEMKTPLNDSTLFNVGSIGKDFTQVVMIQLATEGKLKFDDPLSKYLQLFPDSIGRKITLRMLLRMQSGLGDYHDRSFRSLQDRIDYIKTLPLLFEPGTDEQYSNSGYVLMAAIVEKVTGKSFEQNVTERIFVPLKMKHSHFILPGMSLGNRASATEIKPSGKKVNEHQVNDDATPSGDGGEYSTAPDLLKFYYSLMNDNMVISDSEKEIFFSRFNPSPAHSFRELKGSPAAIGYAGGLNGWNTCIDIHFKSQYIVISVSNFDGQPAEELNRRINQILDGKKYDTPQQPRFVFAYDQWKKLGSQKFTEAINQLLSENGYDKIQGPFFYNQIGEALYNDARYDDAIVILRHNTQLFPNAPLTWQWLGMSYLRSGNENQATKALQRCLELDSQNKEAQRILDSLE